MKKKKKKKSMQTWMQKFDHKILIHIYGTLETQERDLVRQDKRAIRVRDIEVLLYEHETMNVLRFTLFSKCFSHIKTTGG